MPSEIHGLDSDLFFGSELQATMDNIFINNEIDSPYLNDLLFNLEESEQRFVSIFSNIVSETDNFNTFGSSEIIVWEDGFKVPEP